MIPRLLSSSSLPARAVATSLLSSFLSSAASLSLSPSSTLPSLSSTLPSLALSFPSASSSNSVFLVALVLGGGLVANQKRIEASSSSITQEADRLYDQGKTEELHALLTSFVSKNPNHAGACWRLSRASRDLSQLCSNAEEKKKLVYAAYEYAKKAISLDPNDYAGHKWAGITLSLLGDYEGTKAQITNAFIIRQHFEQAISLNPRDATSVHLLGLWCFTFADMPWYTAKLAATLFATPPSSSYQEALELFLRAESLDPGFYKKNTLMLGKSLLRLNRRQEAKEWLLKAVALPTISPDDAEAHQEALLLLKGL